ncbi:MAG: 5'/3'-nucleotidase SurE [Bacteroidales bacterium]
MEKRPLILITNDDGYTSKGIEVLIQAVCHLGDVVVVAPDGPRSGMSSAITATLPLRLSKVKEHAEGHDIKIYKCSGTPVDCVKLALNKLLHRHPDVILSGINHGSNASVNVFYSGTMGAALEGCIARIPSVGFSICDHSPEADFEPFTESVKKIATEVIQHGLPEGICLNVNYPKVDTLEGTKVCRQADTFWSEEFEACVDPHGRNYYWLTGMPVNRKPDLDNTDDFWLEKGYATIVPTKIDLTADEFIHEFAARMKDV